MQKLWCCSSARVWGESAMFFGLDVVKLAFPATEILRVYNSLLGVEYLPGRDYRHDPGTACLVRPAGSQIPFLAKEKQFPAAEKCIFYPAPGHNAIPQGVDGRALIFDNQDFFARQQIEIDYQAEKIDFPPVISQQGDRLPRWRQKLSGEERPLKLTFLGDSITYGYNASKVMGSAPWQPCYAELVQQELQHVYGGKIILCNRGVNGSGCRAALKEAEQWLPDCPDLLIIAYGMNDLTSMTPEQYADTIREIMTLARKKHAESEYLLVSPMSGNPLWRPTPLEQSAAFAKALRELVAGTPDAALADVQSFWTEFMQRKNFYDLTGNGVNHPNDYGHRIYASVLLRVLGGV